MAIAYVASGVSPGADSTTCVVVKPAGLAAGHLMVAHIVSDKTAGDYSVTPPASWTLIRETEYGATSVMSSLFWKIADAADASASDFTFTLGANAEENKGWISAWSGTHLTTPINANNGTYTSESGTTITSASITPTVANCVVCFFASVNALRTVSTYAIATNNPASWSEAYDAQYNSTIDITGSMAYAARPETSATGNGTAELSSARASIGQMIAIAPPSTSKAAHYYNRFLRGY